MMASVRSRTTTSMGNEPASTRKGRKDPSVDCDCEADCEREKLARRARGWFNLVRARRHTAAVECARVRARSRGCGSCLVREERRAVREIVKVPLRDGRTGQFGRWFAR